MSKNILIKEYTFYFRDKGNRYCVHLCRGFPRTQAFVSRMYGQSRMGTPLKVSECEISNWRDLIFYWYILLHSAVRRLKRNMLKQRRKQCCQCRCRNTGQCSRGNVR